VKAADHMKHVTATSAIMIVVHMDQKVYGMIMLTVYQVFVAVTVQCLVLVYHPVHNIYTKKMFEIIKGFRKAGLSAITYVILLTLLSGCAQQYNTGVVSSTTTVEDSGGYLVNNSSLNESGCGDGFCDIKEAIMGTCELDCGKTTKSSGNVTETELQESICGNGVCDLAEAHTGSCPIDCS